MKKFLIGTTFMVFFALTYTTVLSRGFRANEIPNGGKNNCANCHVNSAGGGQRNSFGMAIGTNFLSEAGSAGHVQWGPELANLDSDGDGFTNGEELQDPTGSWKVGDPLPGDSNLVTNPGDPASHPAYSISITENPGLGKILTDSAGMTLYFFSKDAFDTSACFGQCEINWPVFYTPHLNVPAGLDTADFDSFLRSDSKMQTTYKGWPLYYFKNDAAPGDINGEGKKGVWFVAKPDYSIMLVNNQLKGHDGIEYNSNYEPGQEVIQYFVDSYGRTLYTFKKDTENENNFTKSDFSNNAVWPIYEEEFKSAPSIIDSSLFGTIDVFGHTQLTYKGWPLYYFGQDSSKRGLNKGVSFPKPGVWPVARKDINLPTGVAENNSTPHEFLLKQNYPNPFNPTTTIKYTIANVKTLHATSQQVQLKVYNILGKEVATLVNARQSAGNYEVSFDASDLTSGIYIYQLTSGGNTLIKKMVLLK